MREFLLALVIIAATIGGVLYMFNPNQVHVLTNSIVAIVLD